MASFTGILIVSAMRALGIPLAVQVPIAVVAFLLWVIVMVFYRQRRRVKDQTFSV